MSDFHVSMNGTSRAAASESSFAPQPDGIAALAHVAGRLHHAFARIDAGDPPVDDFVAGALIAGHDVPEVELASQGVDVAALVRLGMLGVSNGQARADALFERWDGLLLGRHRVTQAMGEPESADGIGPNAKALSRMIPRMGAGDVLDIGCGQGFHAIRAAAHARRVVATDVSRHAMRLAAINAVLNRASHVEYRKGSLYEPVAGESFDLIVSNTPFVFSPVHVVSGDGAVAVGDAFSEALVRGAPGHLCPGGFGVFICNWEHAGENEWEARPRSWVDGAGVDAWIVRLRTSSVDRVIAAWFSSRQGPNADNEVGCAESLRRWRDHIDAAGVDSLSMGMIFLRKRAGVNWVRCESHALGEGDEQAGGQVCRIFENQTLLEGPGDVWLERHLKRADAVVAATHEDGRVLLQQPRGFRCDLALESVVLEMLVKFDGDVPARVRCDEAAKAAGIPIDRVVPVVRELFRRGYLEVSAGG